jgi:hypothetical protein
MAYNVHRFAFGGAFRVPSPELKPTVLLMYRIICVVRLRQLSRDRCRTALLIEVSTFAHQHAG